MARSKGTGSVFYDERRSKWIGTIEAGWTERGTRRRLTVSGDTEREARQKLRAREAEVAASGTPDENTRAGLTVKAYADTWLEEQERMLRPAAFNATRSQIRRWVIPTIGHRRLDRLSPADVRAVTKAMESSGGLATSSVSRAHSELVRMLGDAFAAGNAVPERARGTKFRRGQGVTKARSAMSLEHALAVLTAARARPDFARWAVALMTGLRPAEARGLTWDRVDFKRGVLVVDWQLKPLPYRKARDRASGFRVPRDYEAIRLHDAYHLVRPKTSSGWRVVPMVPLVSNALRDWAASMPPSPHGLVFPGPNGRALDDKLDRAAWRDLCEVAGVGVRDLYEARHTTATLLLAYGASQADIIAILGHSSILSSQAYLHADVESARASLARIESAMNMPAIEA